MEYYHVTENKYIDSIKANGLTPQRGKRSKLIGDERKAIFYSQGLEGVIAMFFMMIERYVQYNENEGDVHINTFNIIKKMVEDKEAEGKVVGDYLREKLLKESEIVNSIKFARGCSTYKEFLGDGVVLKIDKMIDDENELSHNFYNCLTTSTISPTDIKVLAIKHPESGLILHSKYDIFNFAMSKISLSDLKNILYLNLPKKIIEEHLLWRIMSDYYKNNVHEIEKLKCCEIIEIPILDFVDEKCINQKGK